MLLFPALVLLLTACASAPNDNATDSASTTDFDVEIAQTNEPILLRSQNALDFRYSIQVRNRTAEPITLKRISITSVGSGPARIGTTLRAYDKVIPPQGSESVEFWATAYVNDYTPDYRPPLTLRVRPTIRAEDGKDRTETFLRQLRAQYHVATIP